MRIVRMVLHSDRISDNINLTHSEKIYELTFCFTVPACSNNHNNKHLTSETVACEKSIKHTKKTIKLVFSNELEMILEN